MHTRVRNTSTYKRERTTVFRNVEEGLAVYCHGNRHNTNENFLFRDMNICLYLSTEHCLSPYSETLTTENVISSPSDSTNPVGKRSLNMLISYRFTLITIC